MGMADPILIVGAGPTGLAMAAALARYGIACRIVDKSPAPATQSKALAVQARTLELFDQLGVVDEMLARGQKVRGMEIFSDSHRLAQIHIDNIPSEYPFILGLAQSQTEQILIAHLERQGIAVERPVELMALAQDDTKVTATLKDGDGHVETVSAPFVIGCDSAHSAVRHSVQIPFVGAEYPEVWALADVKIAWDLPADMMHLFMHPKGLFATIPLEQGRQRIIAELPGIDTTVPLPELALGDFQRMADERAGSTHARISDPVWMSHFRLHLRHAERYRQGRVFLAGDAAHIHSPAGGQGMNTGIQDAYNLAWKLALALQGHAQAGLLDTYESERVPVAQKVMRMSDTMIRMTAAHNPMVRGVRNLAMPLASRQGVVQRMMTQWVSELAVNYRESAIVAGHGRFSGDLKPGDRAPDAQPLMTSTGDGVRLFDLLRRPQHILLLFAPPAPQQADWQRLTAFADAIDQRHAGLIAPYLIVGDEAEQPTAVSDARVLHDARGDLRRTYGVTAESLYLIRPDGYIGFRSQPPDEAGLESYLRRIFG
jgi:2-polyprenyl-6-methoxyphenol hydroxylase-like FAD-dependent oxidoreductase